AEGIRFTILAPHQVEHAPPGGLPGCYRTPGGRSIALFVYDGPISHDVAFGPLLKDAAAWAERLLAPAKGKSEPRLVAVATDGETYGHHHRFGEVALAWLLRELERRSGVRVENFAAFLARHPPRHDVALVAPTSWSCAHGVERWRADCGCRMAPERPTQQRWRAPLRAAPRIELAGADAPRLEAGVLGRLVRAEANEPGAGTGRDVYLSRVKRRVPAEAASRPDSGGPGGDAARELLRAVTLLEHDRSPR